MARIAHVTLVDDLDGTEASETVVFSLGGRHYEIDLSAENAAKLRDVIAPFVAAARRSDGTHRARKTRAGGSPPQSTIDRVKGGRDPRVGPTARPQDRHTGRMPRWILGAYRNEVG